MNTTQSLSLLSMIYFYSMDGKHSTHCGIRFELDDFINYLVMNEALQRCMKRFSYLCRKLVEVGDSVCLQENDAPVVLHEEPLNVVINAQKNDGHLIRFSSWGKTLTIQVFHGLADGACMLNLIKVLLVEYYKALGEEVVAPADLFDMNVVNPEETGDPYASCNDVPLPSAEKRKFYVCKERRARGIQGNICTFSCSAEKFMKYVKSTGASPNAAAAVMMAKAISEVYPRSAKKGIDIGVAINAKPFVNASKAHVPCFLCSTTRFDRKTLAMDVSRQHAFVRNQVRKDTLPEKILYELNCSWSFRRVLECMTSIKPRRLICQKITDAPAASATISYVGRFDFGSIEKHINGIYTITDSSICPVLELNCTSDRFFFSLNTCFDARDLAQVIYETCVALDLDCSELVMSSFARDKGKSRRMHLGLNRSTFKLISAIGKVKKMGVSSVSKTA